jgi:uncharacterized protein YndB with AHSA1/START domain
LTTQVVSTTEVTAKIFIEAPVSQLYYLFSTRSGWFDWFAHKGLGNVAKGGILQLYHETAGPMAFFFQELNPDKRIIFTFLTQEKLPAGEVEISLEQAQGGAEIRVEHAGLEPDEADKFQTLWQDSLNNLKELMEEGRDPRLWNRPFLGVTVADWVTPEYAAENNLATESGMHLNSVFKDRGAAEAGISRGDTIITLAGIAITDYESLFSVYVDHRAGDTIDVEYYHGEEFRQSRLTLSAYPVPEVPSTALDIADKLDHFLQKVNAKIERILAGQNEAKSEYRPGAGEWNAKEILAHLIASENDSIHWLGSYLAGREVHPYTAGTAARLKSLLVLYPTTSALQKKLRETQKELVALISEIPAEVVNRKASMVRLAFAYSMDVSMHYKEHLAQLSETLESASDLHSHEGS